MKLNEIKQLDEASYPGNIGMVEMFKFYQIASDNQKQTMKDFIEKKMFVKCWELLEKVTGIKLVR